MNKRVFTLSAVALALGAVWLTVHHFTEPNTDGPKTVDAADPSMPNVVMIVWDTARADRMSLYGHSVSTTPWLDQWAASGLVFEQAVSPSFWTLPAHASIFTGTHVQTHGATWENPWLDDDYVTMAEWFQGLGYETFGWSTNPNVHSLRNTHQGFETFLSPFDEDEPWRDRVLDATKKRLHPQDASTPISPLWKGKRKEAPMIAAGVARDALMGWLDTDGRSSKPFFAFVNLMEVHDPRLPTEPVRSSIFSEENKYKRSLSLNASPARMRKATALRRPYSASQQAVLKGVYDATLVDLDRSTKRIFEDLDSRGALDNTIVLLTSDHGEAFGEHGYYRHNRGLHQEMVRVPLVLWYPKKVKSGRMDEPVSTAAVFGEVCRLVDASCPQTDGFIQGGLRTPTSEPIIADGRQPVGKRKKRDPKYMWEDLMAIYMDGWKMILGDDGTQELYRIDPDDMEQENVHADHPEVATKLASRLEQWKQQTPRRVPGQRDNPSGTDENMEGLLKTLGYLE